MLKIFLENLQLSFLFYNEEMFTIEIEDGHEAS